MVFNCVECPKVYQSSGSLQRHIKQKHTNQNQHQQLDNEEQNNNIIQHNHPNFIEVCSGGGGLSSGLIQAGFHPLLLNDNNKD